MEESTFKAPPPVKEKSYETYIAIVGSSSLPDLTEQLDLLLGIADFHKNVTCVKIMGTKNTSADLLGKLFADYLGVRLFKEGGSSSPLPLSRRRAASKLVERNDVVVAFWDCESRGIKDIIDMAMVSGKMLYMIPKKVVDNPGILNKINKGGCVSGYLIVR